MGGTTCLEARLDRVDQVDPVDENVQRTPVQLIVTRRERVPIPPDPSFSAVDPS